MSNAGDCDPRPSPAFRYNRRMLSEFALIQHYFTRPAPANGRVALGIGDDCALLQPDAGMQLAVSTDMLVEGRHFFAGADPARLGHKCLAVNLSDLAAMGATPFAFTLALALPSSDPAWLEGFSSGLLALAARHDCPLVGGDTTRGPLTISITVFGQTTPGKALRRDGARPGDDIWVSGSLGGARVALAALRGENLAPLDASQLADARNRLECPQPQIALGLALRGIASAAIDLSDGLTGDLGHILARSCCGATVAVDTLPTCAALRTQSQALQHAWSLAGGDDYELCFTTPPAMRDAVATAAARAGTVVTRIGMIDAAPGLRLHAHDGADIAAPASFDHFQA